MQSVIAVVEPHADDAFLSIGSLLAGWDGPKLIVTVLHDARRGREAAAYAASIGAEWVGLGLPESRSGLRNPRLVRLPIRTADIIAAIPVSAFQLWPLGLQHPEHRAVAGLAPENVLRYAEQPYAAKPKNAAELASAIEGRRLLIDRIGADRSDGRRIFRSQSLFFHYERDRLRAPVERVWSGV